MIRFRQSFVMKELDTKMVHVDVILDHHENSIIPRLPSTAS